MPGNDDVASGAFTREVWDTMAPFCFALDTIDHPGGESTPTEPTIRVRA